MKVIEINEKDRELWNEMAKTSGGSFLQSYEWGEFKEGDGHKIWRLAIAETKLRGSDLTSHFRILAICQVIEENVPYLGRYLYVPHGPIFNTDKKEATMQLLEEKLKQIAKTEQAMFVRFEPKISLRFSNDLTHYKSSIQAIYTLKVNLEGELEQISASFKKDTRYSIRQAQKKGVKIEIGAEKDLDKFYELLEQTGKQAGFEIYSREYYQKLYSNLKKNNLIELFLAKYQGKIIGAALAIYFGREATYSYSAADSNFRNLAVAYPIVWSIIKEAKKRKMEKLDLWGVAPENEINHPWQGFTHFKRGFAPSESIHAYPGSYFLILNHFKFNLYILQKLARGRKV